MKGKEMTFEERRNEFQRRLIMNHPMKDFSVVSYSEYLLKELGLKWNYESGDSCFLCSLKLAEAQSENNETI